MAWDRSTTAHQRGYGRAWRKLRERVMDRDNHQCVPCTARGLITAAAEVDHIKPKTDGGTDDMKNLQAICKACHAEKTQREAKTAQGSSHSAPRFAQVTFDPSGRPIW